MKRRSLYTCALLSAFVLSMANAAVHSPYITKEHAFEAQQNEFGTTSVGIRASALEIYYEHGSHEPQPPPRWLQMRVEGRGTGAIAERIELTINGNETLQTDGCDPYLGISSDDLSRLANARDASATLLGRRLKETIVFQPEDFQNVRKLLDYGARWKSPADPTEELAGVWHVINLASLPPEHLENVTTTLKRTLKKHRGTDEHFDLYGAISDEEGMAFTARGTRRATEENIAKAEVFLDNLKVQPKSMNAMLDLSSISGWHSRIVTVHTTPKQRIDDEDKALREARIDLVRLNFVIFDSASVASDAESAAIAKMERLAAATGGVVVKK